MSLNQDHLIKISEYAENWYQDKYCKYPINSDKALKVGKEWSLDVESAAFTYKGRLYFKFKHHTNDGCMITWYKSKGNRWTAYNVAKKCEVIFI